MKRMKKKSGRKPKYKTDIKQMNVRIAKEKDREIIRKLEKELLSKHEK